MRRRSYTARGIRRVPCFRCCKPSHAEWRICADGNRPRGICFACDADLNAMVLAWAGDPEADAKMTAYRNREAS